MITQEIGRMWALLSWRERLTLVGRAVGAYVANGIGMAGSGYLMTRMAAGDYTLQAGPLLGVFVFGGVLGLLLFLARPGLKSWRR